MERTFTVKGKRDDWRYHVRCHLEEKDWEPRRRTDERLYVQKGENWAVIEFEEHQVGQGGWFSSAKRVTDIRIDGHPEVIMLLDSYLDSDLYKPTH